MNNNKAAQRKPVNQVWMGVLLVAAGLITGAYRLGAGIPEWLVSWPVALVGFGILLGIYHQFKNFIWAIPVFWGCWLLALLQFPSLHLGNYTPEAGIILVGLVLLVNKRGPAYVETNAGQHTGEGIFKITAFLRNARKSISTPNFKRAEITCVLGNGRLDLRDAGATGNITVDATVLLGNTKIYIPAAWTVQNDITAVFGEVRHNRVTPAPAGVPQNVVKLDGTAVLGNIEIISA